MQKLVPVATVVAMFTTAAPSVVMAQGVTQTITAVDVRVLDTGLRSSKIVGSDVISESKDTVGKIDDLIVSQDRKLFAIVSVGGFLGIGTKLVAVRYDDLRPTPDSKGFVLSGATKDSLKALPEFRYRE